MRRLTLGSPDLRDHRPCSQRVLSFDEKAGLIWARLMADARTKQRPGSALDTIIAAVAAAYECVVVTDNEKDFFDIEIVNPIRDGRE